jgi:hypothetical protein
MNAWDAGCKHANWTDPKNHTEKTQKKLLKKAIRLPCRHRYRYLIQTENLWVSFKIWCPSVAC